MQHAGRVVNACDHTGDIALRGVSYRIDLSECCRRYPAGLGWLSTAQRTRPLHSVVTPSIPWAHWHWRCSFPSYPGQVQQRPVLTFNAAPAAEPLAISHARLQIVHEAIRRDFDAILAHDPSVRSRCGPVALDCSCTVNCDSSLTQRCWRHCGPFHSAVQPFHRAVRNSSRPHRARAPLRTVAQRACHQCIDLPSSTAPA